MMRKFFKIGATAFWFVLVGCNSTKQVTSNENENSTMETAKELINKGYLEAELVNNNASKGTGCSTVIKLTSSKNNEVLDPINFEGKYEELKNSKVWVKYTSLRMKNRCDEARPVNVVDMKKREE